MCRALPGGLARSPAAACARRETAEAAVLSAPSRGGVAVTVVSAAPRGVRSGSVLAQRAHSRSSVVHAQREHAATRTHHQATRGDITTRSAAVPHSAKHAPPLERLCLCVVLWPSGVWLCFLIRFIFARAHATWQKARSRPSGCQKIENEEKGRCFVLNRADGALP